ncbi:hypothetical protein HDF16_000010 [Granulicella aggregans]|uniref:Uncharacterized protein n=1 Tax=Granulicella aggregans TaxID=474949 RepID=A0A7W7Z8P7_9BACT|nr:hypothetical protein [Granulicella aggregans]MBB5055341.1 hypothetical protein [Granulicella aggregans]
MWRYFKAAFLVGVDVPGVGRLPINAMAAFAVAALGFVEPSVWLAGLGIEAAVVSSLAFNSRFQNVVDALALPASVKAEADKRSALIAALPANLNARLVALHKTATRVIAICQKLGAEPETIAGTQASLDKLEWICLKLLIARDHLVNDLGLESAESLDGRIAALRKQLPDGTGAAAPSTGLQRSQMATLDLLERRMANLRNRETLLAENESDLCRIEAQVELMRENAAIEGKPAAVDTEIEFASDLRSTEIYGTHGELVRDLDAARSGS